MSLRAIRIPRQRHQAIRRRGYAAAAWLVQKVSTLTAYYEKYGFSARVAARKRSDFVGEIEGFGADRAYTYIKGESIVDLQFGYEFQSGFAKGLSLLFQVNNSDAKYQEYQNTRVTSPRPTSTGRPTSSGLPTSSDCIIATPGTLAG